MNSLKKGEGVPLLNFEGVPGPGSGDPGPTFKPCLTNSCCNVSQTFSYLTYQNSTFTTSIKKNEKVSRLKNFSRFRGFALHYESAESAESSESVLLPDKRLDYLLTELKLVPNVQNSRRFNHTTFLLERQQQGSRDTRIERC